MIKSPDPQFKLKAIKAIPNFTKDGIVNCNLFLLDRTNSKTKTKTEEHREMLVDSDVLPLVIQLCTSADDIIKENALRALYLLAEGGNPPPLFDTLTSAGFFGRNLMFFPSFV